MTNKAIVKTGNLKIGIWFNQNSEQNVRRGPSSKICQKINLIFIAFQQKLSSNSREEEKKKKVTAKKIKKQKRQILPKPARCHLVHLIFWSLIVKDDTVTAAYSFYVFI